MHSSDSQQKVPQDVVAIFHTSFHPTQGNIIDWSLKASDGTHISASVVPGLILHADLDLTHVEFSCLPSGLHLIDRDVVYFNKGDHQGVCIFRRRKTAEHGHRGFRLSSLGILLAKSPRPRPWQHVSALKALVETIYSSLEDRDALEPVHSDWDPARTFFEDRKARQPDLGGTGEWKGWSAELDSDAPDSNPTIHLPHMLRILGPSSLTLYKHILARRRILIITLPPVEAACILCQVAADICYEEQADGEGSASSDDESQRRTKGKCKEGMKDWE
ncbi:Protein LCHN [Grifola frondosa]|uniref:Protein LCHN n=1 Tax=Grifola frondosa TaxID=5627 RepID=A0A1C7MEF7_GRIFR|nr:Protein LCHN [Grifola frondosa]